MKTSSWKVLAIAFLLGLGGAPPAQTAPNPAATNEAPAAAADAGPAPDAPAGDAAAAAGGDAPALDAAAAPPKKPAVPRPSEMAHRAPHALLLAVTDTGKGLVAVGARGNIVLSSDGETWTQVQAPVSATLTAVAFADPANGWAVGHDSVILHTTDAGRTWTLQNFKPELEKPLLNLLVLDATHVYAVGAYGLFLQTSDGGATWTEVASSEIRGEALHLNALIRLGNGEYFLAGEEGMMGVSQDGQKWERLTSPYEASLFGAVARGEKGALVYGLRGNVFVTDDVRAGQWTPVDLKSKQSMFGAATLQNGDVGLVGADGTAYVVGKDGAARQAKQPVVAGAFGAGTLSGAVVWKDGLLAVGEQGSTHIKLGP